MRSKKNGGGLFVYHTIYAGYPPEIWPSVIGGIIKPTSSYLLSKYLYGYTYYFKIALNFSKYYQVLTIIYSIINIIVDLLPTEAHQSITYCLEPPFTMLKIVALLAALAAASAQENMCETSPQQTCRARCANRNCPDSQCMMREGVR